VDTILQFALITKPINGWALTTASVIIQSTVSTAITWKMRMLYFTSNALQHGRE